MSEENKDDTSFIGDHEDNEEKTESEKRREFEQKVIDLLIGIKTCLFCMSCFIPIITYILIML
ncbi:MAG: hypothetical protein ACTSWX_02090 [Promethearchaeota archaeon]